MNIWQANVVWAYAMRATAASYLLFGLGPYPTLDLTAAEVFAISQGAASLPGRWSAISQCTNDGITYAGLIDPAGNGRVAVLIARDIEGLYVARVSGEVVARGCANVTDALTAVRWLLRQA